MPVEGGSPKKPFDFGNEEAEVRNIPDEDPVLALRELVIEAQNVINALRDLIRNEVVPQNDVLQPPVRPAGSVERAVQAGDNLVAEGGQVHAATHASVDLNPSGQMRMDEGSSSSRPQMRIDEGSSSSRPHMGMDEGSSSSRPSAAAGHSRPSAAAATASDPYRQGAIGLESVRMPAIGAESVRESAIGAASVRESAIGAASVRESAIGAEAVRTPAIGAEAIRPAVMGAESERQTSAVSEDCEIPLPIKYASVSEIEAESFEQCEEISEPMEVSSDSSGSNEDQ